MRILIGAPVRQDEMTFKLYLDSLKALNTEGLEVEFLFLLHGSEHLIKYLEPHQYLGVTPGSEYKRDDITHHWTNENLAAVTYMKNRLLFEASAFDAFFLVDSDIILHPETLQQLVKADKPIVSNVFWTKWQPDEAEMPNAWNYDHYSFLPGELERWREPGIYPVGMSGACILIKREVILAGVNYSPIYNVSHSLWEDRAFCIRAACAGFQIYMDTTYPAKHLYRESDIQEVLNSEIPS
ncbi:hypothetical protein [Paenibacillus oryzisoli]|uniref:Glycosyltransferase n=1 Tax=Paenibacillus oryzisoli TaxID=1850517 RepID=A0A198AJB3_9BACL|nr:hypothetical protein [Paenibacillus oryzisoli]OAS21141.1 hypothetical protein A8708_30080 [Paenibacillus oryzisoli]